MWVMGKVLKKCLWLGLYFYRAELGQTLAAESCMPANVFSVCISGLHCHVGVTGPPGQSVFLWEEAGKAVVKRTDLLGPSSPTQHPIGYHVKGLLNVISNLPDHWWENAHQTQENAHQTLFSLGLQYNLYFLCCWITLISLDFLSAFAVCRSCSHSRSHWRRATEWSKKKGTRESSAKLLVAQTLVQRSPVSLLWIFAAAGGWNWLWELQDHRQKRLFWRSFPLAVHSHIRKQERMEGSQHKSSGELGPELKIPVGSKDLQLGQALFAEVLV